MTAAAAIDRSPLWQCLQGELAGPGFEPWPARRLFVRQRPGALYDVVGLRPARAAPTEAVVFFTVWSPDVEGVAAEPDKDQRRAIKSFAFALELSPVAPLKNSYWWPLEMSDDEQLHSLRRQLGALALPYFDSIGTPGDLVDVLDGRADPACQMAATRCRARARTGPRASGPSPIDVAAEGLLAAGLQASGFTRADEFLWRSRGELIDIVVIDTAADGRFVEVSLVVWHTSITEGIDGPLPQGITLATAVHVSAGGVGADPIDALWFIGSSAHARAGLAHMPAAVVPRSLAHFEGRQTRADVLASLPEVYRPHFPSA